MSGRRGVLGTAGHIDHGKTALVRALTGVDTDRLEEERRRGITIDLGFAELVGEGGRAGVVDVPGHEGFIRNMVAGAAGVDVVLLVVAADEGVMPQTREHLAIVELLEIPRLVVALTKVDLVEDPAWLDLVRDDVASLLGEGPYADAPVLATSAETGEGVEALAALLLDTLELAEPAADLARLPVDRVFTVKGTGTVVTGTLRSGALEVGERVRVLPGGPEARIRGVQVHGRDVERARAGERTAVALVGAGVETDAIRRGQALVTHPGWPATSMLTVRLRVLPDTGWAVEHNQRVRVHLGTAEVMARCAALRGDGVGAGETGWVQLRLEEPLVARAGDRVVVRSYSPVTTIAGGRVAEPLPPKRTRLADGELRALTALVDGSPRETLGAALELAGWAGVEVDRLPVLTGLPPSRVEAALETLEEAGALVAGDAAVGPRRADEARERLRSAVAAYHRAEPLRAGLDAEALRQALPTDAAPGLADRVLAELEEAGEVAVRQGIVSLPDFAPTLSAEQEGVRGRLRDVYRDAGLAMPSVAELPGELAGRPDLWPMLKLMEADGELVALEGERFVWAETLADAAAAVREALSGREDLGPADFKDVIPVSRKHLLPILNHFDTAGLTVRRPGGRAVQASS